MSDTMKEAEEPDTISLSAHSLAALQDFYRDREEQERRFEDLKAAAEDDATEPTIWSMDMFSEDWNASQFWYDDGTAKVLATELMKNATSATEIAVISAPSVYVQLRNIMNEASADTSASGKPQATLLEYDERFRVLPGFVHYDFQQPLRLDPSFKGRFDRILCDPPFLSPDCQTKAAMTVRWLSKRPSPENGETKPDVMVCTGERMEDLVHRLYAGIHTTSFLPRHAQDRLSNDFRCYATFESDFWSFS